MPAGAVVDPYRIEFEDEPDPRDLALLEDRMAQAAVEAAGVGDEREFAVLYAKTEGSSPERPAPCGAGAVSFMSCGSTRHGGMLASGER